MFSPRKGKQTTFVYGPEIYEKLVSRDHLLYKINELVDFTFINEECRNLYSESMGRPVTNTPEIMKLKIYKYFYGEITILPQMRTYLIYRAYRTDKYALYSDSR